MYINTVKNAVYYSRDHAIVNSSGGDRQARRQVPRTADWPYNTMLLEPMEPKSEVRYVKGTVSPDLNRFKVV